VVVGQFPVTAALIGRLPVEIKAEVLVNRHSIPARRPIHIENPIATAVGKLLVNSACIIFDDERCMEN